MAIFTDHQANTLGILDGATTTSSVDPDLVTFSNGQLGIAGTLDATNFKVGGAQGTDGQVLTSTGSGVGWADAGGGGGGGEEGTWTPTFGAEGGNPTVGYSSQVGYYTKVGQLVTVYGQLITTSRSGGSGTLTVDGLPFTSISNAALASVAIGFNYTWNPPPLNAGVQGGQTHILLYQNSTTNAASVPADIIASGNSYFYFSGSYITAS